MKELFAFIFLWSICFPLCTGCTIRSVEKKTEKQVVSEQAWTLPDYSDFVESNIKNIDQLYTEEYGPYFFVADTSKGSTVVQNLIDTKLAGLQLTQMRFDGLSEKEKILFLHQYVLNTYRYGVEPNIWPTVHETLQWKKGDCKGLSLLLMSLLLASHFEAHAAVSNGHMWVNVNMKGQWQVLELDKDPDRARIYKIPGFYDRPLFKIYEDRTEKRLRKKE
ncbi:MAG: hypothetical protein QNK29_03165 [Desulfobacterales bacterium]|nr:hypothetical protein [Desulfobacterales bacterium]MDX2510991.1 hypothetical protein [Desulfobacterales bacterium]